jgi:hypothetical protein
MRKLIAVLGLALILIAFASPASAAPRSSQLPLGRVTIAGGTYWWANGVTFARLYARSTPLRIVLSAVRNCRKIGFYGFISTSRGAGVVGWAPTSLRGCLPVIGGGPGFAGCLQAMRTPYPDPYGLSGLSFGRRYVLIAATSATTCRDLSTQIPGGIWANTTQAFNGLPGGSLTVIKCQAQAADGLWDFVAPYTNRLPASKYGVWIPDQYVATNVARWAGVPSCWG